MTPETLQSLRDLVRHMEWADAAVWAEVLRREESAADRRIRELLHHAHSVHCAYLQIWNGETLDVPEEGAFRDAAAVREWALGLHRRFPPLLEGLDAAALERPVELPWADHLVERFGKAEPATMAETLLQVTQHSAYHRGQVNARLRELGGEPPLTDYVAWIWMGRPAPAWDAPAKA